MQLILTRKPMDTHRVLKPSISERSDGEESIGLKVVGVQCAMDTQPQP